MSNNLSTWTPGLLPCPGYGRGDGCENDRPRGQSGMVLVAALMVMALLCILAAASISTSTLEVKISANDRNIKQAFYLCEAGIDKARYEIVKGWGLGTGGTTGSDHTFTFTPATMPAAVQGPGVIGWGSAGKWVNFTLVDNRGLIYPVTGSDASYGLTLSANPLGQPADGRAHLYYGNTGLFFQGSGTPTGTALELRFSGMNWAVNSLRGYYVIDVASPGTVVDGVISNTADTLTLHTVTPAAGTYRLYSAWPGVGSLSVAPGIPNSQWSASTFGAGHWWLRDSAGVIFRITGAGTTLTFGRTALTLFGATAPQLGAFQLFTSPWAVSYPTVTFTSSSFPAPSGTVYGTTTVNVTPGANGLIALQSTSSTPTGGDTQQIQLTAQLGQNGGVQVRDWKQP